RNRTVEEAINQRGEMDDAPPEYPLPQPIIDKVLHVIGFVVLGVVTSYRFARGPRSRRAGVFLLVWVGLAGYAALDELTQPFVGRMCEFGDWMADLFGALIGLTIIMARNRLRSSPSLLD
ncbi:MAG: VanZ family protein, partial [Phycisphaerae bacterium]